MSARDDVFLVLSVLVLSLGCWIHVAGQIRIWRQVREIGTHPVTGKRIDLNTKL